VRSVRIVTVIEETPGRNPVEARTRGARPGDSEAKEGFKPEKQLPEYPFPAPWPGRMPQDLDSPSREAVLAPRIPSESRYPLEEKTEDAEREDAWQPLLGPASATPAVPSVPGSTVIPVLESPEGIPHLSQPQVRDWAPGFPKKERSEAAPFSREGASHWPELPASAESDDLEDARILCRELRRQGVLEEEQRGIPWNA
jgi:hypothetical protein